MATVTTTTLNVGMMSVPIGLEKVADKKEPTFDRATQNGNPIKRQELDAATGEVVREEWPAVRGVFEDAKNKVGFKEIPAEKIEEIEEATKVEAFDISAFIPLSDLPSERFTSCYCVKAQKGVNAKPLRILHDALAQTETAGVFKLTLRTRQQPAVIYAKDGALFVNTLVFAEDFRRASAASEQLDAVEMGEKEQQMLGFAVQLVDQLKTTVEDSLDTLTDDAIPLRDEAIQAALAGKPIPKKAAAKGKAKVEDDEDPLLSALKASVAAAAPSKGPREKAKAAA